MHLRCSHCDRTFTKTEHLRRHERSHTKEKPFECHVCHKAYARSDVLARHLRMHMRKDDEDGDPSSPHPSNGDEQMTPGGASYPASNNDEQYADGVQPTGADTTNGHSSLNTPERFNMSHPTAIGPTSYQNHANGQYPALNSIAFGYNQLPTIGNYQSTTPTYPGSVLPSLPPYNSSTSVPNYSQTTYPGDGSNQHEGPSPSIHYNFPPSGHYHEPSIGPGPLSPSYHDQAPWQQKPLKIAVESNVRGSGAQKLNYHQNDFHAGPSDTDLFQAGNGQPEGLQGWLAVAQHSNPVDSILRLDTPHEALSETRMPNRSGTGTSKTDIHNFMGKIMPLTNGSTSRYAKVEQTWYSRLSSQGRWPGTEKRWYDVLQGMSGNLFECMSPTCVIPPDGSLPRISEACRARMIAAMYPKVNNPYNPASLAHVSEKNWEETLARFPSCDALDVGLDKYFSSFLREAPFFHMPVFSISTCHPLLLVTMCCIGLGIGKTPEGCHFVQNNFNCVRDRIISELERKIASTTKDAMSIFATSFLFLKLAALISDRDHLTPCQLLYTSLISLAQMHGMFSEYGKRTSVDMYNSLNSLQDKWMAWGRVESLKRISVSLMRLDSAYGTFLKSAPTIRVTNIEVLLPCDDRLFEAPTAEAWYALVEFDHCPLVMPPLSSNNSLDVLVGKTLLNYYSLHAVLNYLQLRCLDAYQRLLDYQSTQEADQFILVPYQYFVTESSLYNMTLHIVAFVDSYQALLPQNPTEWQRTNCLVFWHFLCLSLTMNQDLFEIAAGREGSKPAAGAIDSIAIWSRTPAARRALIHAASVYQLLSRRTQAEMSSIYGAFATFAAALVMTLYVFANPQAGVAGEPYELTQEVDWVGFGLAGLSADATAIHGSAAETFILRGGPYLFGGHTLEGFSGARYILTRYADLLKNCGRYNYRQMSQILFMMSDLLEEARGGH